MLSTRDRRMVEEIKRGLCAADPALSNGSEPQWRTRWNRFVPREQGLRQPRGESALEPSLPAVGLAIPGGVVVVLTSGPEPDLARNVRNHPRCEGSGHPWNPVHCEGVAGPVFRSIRPRAYP